MAYMMAMRWASFSAIGLPSELGYSTAGGGRTAWFMGDHLDSTERDTVGGVRGGNRGCRKR